MNQNLFAIYHVHTQKKSINVNIEGKGVVDRSSTVIAKDPEGKQFLTIIYIEI